MSTPNENESKDKANSIREGYEVTDVSVSGVAVFLIGLLASVAVFFVFCFVMGKVINNALVKRDGPVNKWNATASAPSGKLKNMESNPAGEQIQLEQLTHSFPTPRLQTDNGTQDLVDLHRREDLLLDHYSWVDQSNGKVRIPIDRAMEIIAQRGLPVEQKTGPQEPLMFGDSVPTVQTPLTDGFARTEFEQEEDSGTKPGQRPSSRE
ncbi:MAG: hypothetical protein WBD10_09515 [Acidobacteriaceae bacterium]